MAYFRASDLRRYSGGLTAAAATVELAKEAKSFGSFDVFLSHSVRDAAAVLGLKKLLEGEGLSVYVDWIEDRDLDRSAVSPATAARLRSRMNTCKTMVYATSKSASSSRWMPWELGFFDGIHGPETVSICPIDTGDSGRYVGEEYLGLYKTLEQLQSNNVLRPYAVVPTRQQAETLRSFAARRGEFVTLR
jgi:hypothetical protein